MSNINNVKMGVCKVIYDGIDLGYTKGGVEVSVSTDTHQVMIDQFGESVVNEFITKRIISVVCPLAETTLDNLVQIMPGATLNTDANGRRTVDVKIGIGQNLLSIARPLTLHPISKPDSDVSEDFTVLKAASAGSIKFAYKHNEERIFNVTLNGYPDKNNGNKLFSYGDTTVVGGVANIVSQTPANQLFDSLGQILTDSLGQPLLSA